jgi:hypothetical protein
MGQHALVKDAGNENTVFRFLIVDNVASVLDAPQTPRLLLPCSSYERIFGQKCEK